MQISRKTKQLERAVTRDLPLFMISASYGVRLRDRSTEIIGYPISRNYVLFDRNTAIIYRDHEEWYTEMPNIWATSLDDKRTYEAIRKAINETEVSIRQLNNVLLTPSVSTLEHLRQTIMQGVPGMIFAHWIPIYNELHQTIFKPEDVLYFEKARQKIEKFFSLAAENAYKFIDLLSDEYKVKASLLKFATHDELTTLILTSKIDSALLATRKNQKLLFVEDSLMMGEDIDYYISSIGYSFGNPKAAFSHLIKGSVACVGKVIGKVQIITSRESFESFEDGNILVAPMTSPDYSPLFHKASAIVTDEGGMLSHAAIVSRELNIPCVVGTKHASFVLEDFQEVEVDAERGIVKLLRK